MSVTVFLSTTLRECVPGYNPVEGLAVDVGTGMTVTELAVKIGLPLAEIKITMVNGRRVEMDGLAADGDRIGFFPAVGGG